MKTITWTDLKRTSCNGCSPVSFGIQEWEMDVDSAGGRRNAEEMDVDKTRGTRNAELIKSSWLQHDYVHGLLIMW